MIPYEVTGGYKLSVLGLGCSKFGSLRGASPREAQRVVSLALDLGVTVFDTAASYGQGDSERILGRLLRGRQDICVITKVGKLVPLKARALRFVKPFVRVLVRHSSSADAVARGARGDSLPVSFDSAFLERALIGSLRRLRCERIPMAMLHSASSAVLEAGDAVSVLARAAERGDVGILGVSVDTVEAADAALRDPRIAAIQAPLWESPGDFKAWCVRAKAAGKLVIAREVMRGIGRAPSAYRAEFARTAIRAVLDQSGADVCLVGTTNPAHLSEAVGAFR